MPTINKDKQQDQLYSLLKEMLETQSTIIERINEIKDMVQNSQQNLSERWRSM